MKKLIIFLLFAFISCEQIYYEPELIQGQCYIFEPPQDYYFNIVDTIWIVDLKDEFVLTCTNKGKYVKYKYDNFAMYLRPTPLCNCNY